MFPFGSNSFIFYGKPSEDCLQVVAGTKLVHVRDPLGFLASEETNVFYVVHGLHYTNMISNDECLAAKGCRFMFLPAVPCRETLRLLLNIVLALERLPEVGHQASDEMLAAAMRGYVGVALGEPSALPFRCATPPHNPIRPYPPLLKNDLLISEAPELFRLYPLPSAEAKRRHASAAAASNPCVHGKGAHPTSETTHFFVLDPPGGSELVYALSKLSLGAVVYLYAAHGAPGQPETPEMYAYRKIESDLMNVLKLLHLNSVAFHSKQHEADPYLSLSIEWRENPIVLEWIKDVFLTRDKITLSEIRAFVETFDPSNDLNQLFEALLNEVVVNRSGQKGYVALLDGELAFQAA